MPWRRPTLSELTEQVATGFETELPGLDAHRPQAVAGVLSKVLGQGLNTIHAFAGFVARQVFPDTAEAEFLDRWARFWGVTRGGATPAQGLVLLTGQPAAAIPAGAILRSASGAEFAVSVGGALDGMGRATIAVTARVAGEASNIDPGAALTLVSPLAGVTTQAAVDALGVSGGSDAEDDASLLRRLLLRVQRPPHGGAAFDYVGWALDRAAHGVPVTRAWVFPQGQGFSTVVLRFVCDGRPSILPTAAELAAVQAYVETQRPVTAEVFVLAPVALPVNFTITLNPNSIAVQTAVRIELEDLFAREAEPGGVLLISHIREAVSIAAGESDHVVVAPSANIAATPGQIPILGALTWQNF